MEEEEVEDAAAMWSWDEESEEAEAMEESEEAEAMEAMYAATSSAPASPNPRSDTERNASPSPAVRRKLAAAHPASERAAAVSDPGLPPKLMERSDRLPPGPFSAAASAAMPRSPMQFSERSNPRTAAAAAAAAAVGAAGTAGATGAAGAAGA